MTKPNFTLPAGLHAMIDFETMSLEPNAAIASLGICIFDSSNIVDEFEVTISLDSCEKAGLHFSGGTVEWWLQQSKEAQQALLESQHSLKVAMAEAKCFLSSYNLVGVWSNGPDADAVWFRQALKACNLPEAYGFWLNRCFRTIKATQPQIDFVFNGVHHKALSDALWQAKYLQELHHASDSQS